jgi:formylglycine-generating enzyme required for sulfatase activity
MVRAAVALLLLVLLPTGAWAQTEKRIALLIGNQSYSSEIGRLANPHNDIALLEKALKGLNFEVTVERDVSLGSLTRAVNAYARRVGAAGPNAIAFFYYSGHGAADGGTNYLIPVDVRTTETGELWDQSLRLTTITRQLKTEAGNATHFVVFDACRNTLKLTKAGSRSLMQSKGFVPVAQESGMLIAYATAEGELASDIGAGAGPYARVLADEIVKPGVEAVVMFRVVQRRVRAAISQEPYLGFNALGDVYLAGLPTDTPKPSLFQPQASEAERTWAWIKNTTEQSVLEDFIKQFGDTPSGPLAKARLEELRKQQVAAAVPPKATIPPPATQPTPAVAHPPARCDGVEIAVGASEHRCLKPGSGEVFKDCENCPELVVIPAGEFLMGSGQHEDGRRKDELQHNVVIVKPFALGRFAVTRGEFAAFVRETNHHDAKQKCWTTENGSTDERAGRSFRNVGFAQDDRHPVVCVSWHDAKAYAAWLASRTGKAYRLPSETEREYATRAGTTTPFWWGSSASTRHANYKDSKKAGTVVVDSFKANPWGLFNVAGNVSEWIEDCYYESYEGAPRDASARIAEGCDRRGIRGADWDRTPTFLRSASRQMTIPTYRGGTVGFRLARTLSP